MVETAPVFTPAPGTPEDLERAILDAEAEVDRCERAVLAADGAEAEREAREALTRAEIQLDAALDRRSDGCGCEGWPRGK